MNLLKKPFVVAVVVLWVLMTNHCGLELISGLEFLACSPQSQGTPHRPIDCGSKNDLCVTVEAGQYKVEDSKVSAVKAPIYVAVFVLSMPSSLVVLEPSADRILPEPSPPELARVWQFSFRTALPARAPSVAS